MTKISNDPTKRHEFVLFYDVKNGNPNGDPDANNAPRVHDNGFGYVSDVCIKRKIRDYAIIANENIYVENRIFLQDKKREAYDEVKTKGISKTDLVNNARDWMCKKYYDIRMFGGVLVGKAGEGFNCGQVRGPVQISFSESIDEINSTEVTITRIAREKRQEKQEGENESAFGEIGNKHIIDYALYRVHGFFSAQFAENTGVTEKDLELFWEALQNMWDHDHSANHGEMNFRRLFIFSHNSKLGNARACQLFERIQCEKNTKSPRKFSDYNIKLASEKLPEGVIITEL